MSQSLHLNFAFYSLLSSIVGYAIPLKITTSPEIIRCSELLFGKTFTPLLHWITCLYKFLITKSNLRHFVTCNCTKIIHFCYKKNKDIFRSFKLIYGVHEFFDD